jgi:hypothetical protein
VPFAVSEITGPVSVQESATAYYYVVCTCTKGVSFAWSCEPASAGTFDPDNKSIVAFSTALVDEETGVTISVTVIPEAGDTVTRTRSVTIRDTIH